MVENNSALDIDRKKATFLTLSALGSILVSYLVYRHVVDNDDGSDEIDYRAKL